MNYIRNQLITKYHCEWRLQNTDDENYVITPQSFDADYLTPWSSINSILRIEFCTCIRQDLALTKIYKLWKRGFL